ncbi:MAG: hypothetical protein AABZ44_10315 [Elusimicrobiota bacterium]
MFNLAKMVSFPQAPALGTTVDTFVLYSGLLGDIYAESDMPEDEQKILRYCLEWSDDYEGDTPPCGYVADRLGISVLKIALCQLYHENFLDDYARRVAKKARPQISIPSAPISNN